MRVILSLAAATVLAAADPAFAVFDGDPCTTLTVRVLGRAAVPAISVAGPDGAARALTVASRALGVTGFIVSEARATDLTPATRYVFSAGTAGIAGATALLTARTLPAVLPLRLVNGGDLMHEERWLRASCVRAAALRPDAALIGGDWAYDNADWKQFSRWTTLLSTWSETMRTPEGDAIPAITVIGNHELPAKGGDPTSTPYGILFPEPFPRVVDVGTSLSLLLLDSGHSRSVASQNDWLDRSLAERRARTWTIAAYHVPAWPSVRDFKDGRSTDVRAHWPQRFEAGGLDLALEHHEHALKRTHPLLSGKPAEGGIVYLGDGCWGVKQRDLRTPRPEFIAQASSAHHVWLLEIAATAITATAYAPDGTQLDTTTIAPRP
jgi:hypothetical protein